MDSKSNQILLGVILFLLGIFCLFQRVLRLDIAYLTFVGLGFGFVLLYRTKRKSWSLLLGFYLMFFGFGNILQRVFADSANMSVILDMVLSPVLWYLIPGTAFLILYREKNKNGLLPVGGILVAFGINSLAKSFLPFMAPFRFYLIMGLCFLLIYNNGKYFIGKWMMYLAAIFLTLAATKIMF